MAGDDTAALPEYQSPDAMNAAITDRIRDHVDTEWQARAIGDDTEKARWMQVRNHELRRRLAYQRLLARLFTTDPESWVVKGGVALAYQLDPSRHSKDIDITHVGADLEHAISIDALYRAMACIPTPTDFFSFSELVRKRRSDATGALKLTVEARLGVRLFETFQIDLSPPSDDVPRGVALPVASVELGVPSLDQGPMIQLLELEQQVAEKLCAVFEKYGDDATHSGRWRDLADIAMIAQQKELTAEVLETRVRAEESTRPLLEPNGLPDAFRLDGKQRVEWSGVWGSSGRAVPLTIDEAESLAAELLDPVLAGSVVGTWDPAARRWVG